MVTISLCMIVKNEADTLPRCLDSVGELADEIVIVDTGSTDGTAALARRYTDRVFFFPWRDDFAAARNFAFGQGTMDFLMWLDADDVLEAEDRAAFLALKNALTPEVDLVMARYHTALDEAGRPAFTYYRERLMRRAAGFRWQGAIHEAIAPAGHILYSEAAVTHRKSGPGDPDRNLRIFEGLLSQGKQLSPREQFYYGRELTYHGRDEEAAQVLTAFLDSRRGWLENELEACRDLAGCYERLGRQEERFSALTRALALAVPRAELCCELGRWLLEQERYRAAVFWYEQALAAPPPPPDGGFERPDCRDYVPLLQLCLCWHRLGDQIKAADYNEQAARIKPESAACRHNRDYFAALAQ